MIRSSGVYPFVRPAIPGNTRQVLSGMIHRNNHRTSVYVHAGTHYVMRIYIDIHYMMHYFVEKYCIIEVS